MGPLPLAGACALVAGVASDSAAQAAEGSARQVPVRGPTGLSLVAGEQEEEAMTGKVCPVCGRFIKALGIASHRAMHYRKRQEAKAKASEPVKRLRAHGRKR